MSIKKFIKNCVKLKIIILICFKVKKIFSFRMNKLFYFIMLLKTFAFSFDCVYKCENGGK